MKEMSVRVDGIRSPIVESGLPEATEAVVFVHGMRVAFEARTDLLYQPVGNSDVNPLPLALPFVRDQQALVNRPPCSADFKNAIDFHRCACR